MLEGFMRGLFMAIFASLYSRISLYRMLKKCLVKTPKPNDKLFEYKGKVYDRRKFVFLYDDRLRTSGLSQKKLKKSLEEHQANLVKSKHPDLDMAIIDAYKSALK